MLPCSDRARSCGNDSRRLASAGVHPERAPITDATAVRWLPRRCSTLRADQSLFQGGGSDVANVKTTAVLDPSGNNYVQRSDSLQIV
eukprot:5286979-Amphidinium_carterae.1